MLRPADRLKTLKNPSLGFNPDMNDNSSRNNDPPGLSTLQGQIERVTFYNDETDFTIARLKVPGYRELVTVVGTLMAPTPGQVVRATGEWINHPKFGEQFKILRYTTLVPATVAGIEKYLGSGLIKGIGPVMAKRLVKKFEKDTLKIIEEDSDKLLEVEGIGAKRVKMISKAWADQKEIREVMLFLQSHGVSSTFAAKIFKQYAQRSIDVVKENPYRLAEDIFGIGFITADRIAENLGVEKDSPLRGEAGVIYALNQLADEGHVYYPHEALVDRSREMLQVDSEVALSGLRSLVDKKKAVIEYFHEGEDNPPGDNTAVYLAAFHACEKGIAYALKKLMSAPSKRRKIDPGKAVE